MRRLVLLLVAPIVLLCSGPASGAVVCDGVMHPAPSPQLGGSRQLEGVSADATDDVWVAGRRYSRTYEFNNAFALRWDGTSWTQTPMPHPRRFDLKDIVAFSPTDVWAAGRTQGGAGGSTKYSTIMHWNGATWSESHLRTGEGSIAWAIDGTSGTDIWLVGQRYRLNYTQPLALIRHFDGVSWTRFAIPPPTTGTEVTTALYDVSALAPDDVWAVGVYGTPLRTYALHWDGSTWSRITTPNPGDEFTNDQLRGVVAIAPGDVWAVGSSNFTPLLMHYDGAGFTTSSAPPGMGELFAVTAVTSSEVWAVGRYHETLPPSGPPDALRWTGSAWVQVGVEAAPADGVFTDVASSPSGEVWAVGQSTDPGLLISVGCQP